MSTAVSKPDERLVTDQDIAEALLDLSILPRRVSVDPGREFQGYITGLEGVRAIDLRAAVKSILAGSLKHEFFPSPPGLRLACDAERDKRLAQLKVKAEQARRRRELEQQLADRQFVGRTPEERERVAKILARFRLENAIAKGSEESLDQIRRRLPADKLDRVSNQPSGSEAWRRYLARQGIDVDRTTRKT